MTLVPASKCIWCAEPVVYVTDGWTHEGGTLYLQKCPRCAWEGPQPIDGACPVCGDTELRDDHCAVPTARYLSEDELRLGIMAEPDDGMPRWMARELDADDAQDLEIDARRNKAAGR